MDEVYEDPVIQDPVIAPSKNSRCHVNRKLLPVKGYYFTMLAAVGSLLPFIAIYMKQLHLTPSEAGILYGLMPFISFFIRPLVGALADRWHKHKLILILSTVLTGVFYLLILAIPARQLSKLVVNTQMFCNIQDSYFKDCVSTDVKKGATDDAALCRHSLSSFADFLTDSSMYNGTDLDCEVLCILNVDMHNVDMCFTDASEEFVKYCNGTHVREGPVTIKLMNISHILNNEVLSDRFAIEHMQCRDYDLKSLQYENREYLQLLCDRQTIFKCEMTCQNPPPELCPTKYHEFDSTFGWLFLVYFIANQIFAPVFSLADAATFDVLGKNHHKFGEQRLWGTVGFALLAITSTFIMYMMAQQGNTLNYTVLFYIFAGLCGVAGIIAYFIELSNVQCGSMFKNFLRLISVGQVLVFLGVVNFFGMVTGAIEGFLFWYLSDLGANTLVFGFCLVINCAFEVPLLFLSGKLIKRVGAMPCLYLALLAVAVRMLAYSFLSDPWLVLLIEPLHGITFGIMWPAATTTAALIAPEGMSATIQGLVGGLNFGIGKGIGSLLTGLLFDWLGERWSFRVYGFMSLALLVLYALLNHFVFKSHTSSPISDREIEKSDPDVGDAVQNSQPLLVNGSERSGEGDDIHQASASL